MTTHSPCITSAPPPPPPMFYHSRRGALRCCWRTFKLLLLKLALLKFGQKRVVRFGSKSGVDTRCDSLGALAQKSQPSLLPASSGHSTGENTAIPTQHEVHSLIS